MSDKLRWETGVDGRYMGRCGDCAYWESGVGDTGECHLRPPELRLLDGHPVPSYWPITMRTHWCGSLWRKDII